MKSLLILLASVGLAVAAVNNPTGGSSGGNTNALTADQQSVLNRAVTNGWDLAVWNLHNWRHLRQWRAKYWNAQYNGNTNAVIATLGESWMINGTLLGGYNALFSWAISNSIPIDGVWVPACADGNTLPYIPGVTNRVLGTWTLRTYQPWGPSLSWRESTDIATPASLNWTNNFTHATIVWLAGSGNGKFTWAIDGGATTEINTADTTTHLSTTDITGISDARHSLTVACSAAGDNGIKICGVYLHREGASVYGVRLVNLAHTGSCSTNWYSKPDGLGADSNSMWTAYSLFKPDLLLVSLSLNDQNKKTPVATYSNNFQSIITTFRTARPNSDILLVAGPESGVDEAPAYSAGYATAIRCLAMSNNCALIDAYNLLGDYATANARGGWANTLHVGVDGAKPIVDLFCQALGLRIINSVGGDNVVGGARTLLRGKELRLNSGVSGDASTLSVSGYATSDQQWAAPNGSFTTLKVYGGGASISMDVGKGFKIPTGMLQATNWGALTNAGGTTVDFAVKMTDVLTSGALTFAGCANFSPYVYNDVFSIVTNSSGSLQTITPPANVHQTGTWNVTNVTKIEWLAPPVNGTTIRWTNAVATPLW